VGSARKELPRLRRRERQRRTELVVVVSVTVLALAGVVAYFVYEGRQQAASQKPIILYVNQGNGIVNVSGFGTLLNYMKSHGFNTVFFQAFREGELLFSPATLGSFVNQTHRSQLKIFFALYLTEASQRLPVSIFGLGEDGISLDMPVADVNTTSQESFLTQLKADFGGVTAVTTSDMYSSLRPDLLVIETYGSNMQQYIRSGVIGSVGVFETSSLEDYKSQFQYALQNSDGVMVFDYYGLQKAGY
jgi:hypothetical protein